MSLETVRVSKQGRDQLMTLKRRTGIGQWNILCRWALCVSLAEPTPPRHQQTGGESPVEMTWRTFAGQHEDVYLALIKQRCHEDGLDADPKTLEQQLRLHIHRGIAYLAGDPEVTSIAGLVRKATQSGATADGAATAS